MQHRILHHWFNTMGENEYSALMKKRLITKKAFQEGFRDNWCRLQDVQSGYSKTLYLSNILIFALSEP